jgi:O-antigen ligase
MSRKLFKEATSIIVIALIWTVCLFGNTHSMLAAGISGKALFWTQAVFTETATQRIIFFCVGFYTFAFLAFQTRLKKTRFGDSTNPNLLLLIVLIIGVLVYALNYTSSALHEDALVWLAGVMLGQAAAMCEALDQRRDTLSFRIIVVLILLLSIASLWNVDNGQVRYLGKTRWSGTWHDPNIFGLLMGVGMALAIGLGLQSLRQKVPVHGAEIRIWKPSLWRRRVVILCFVVATLMGYGLLRSYSRGAWIATFFGLTYVIGYAVWCLASERPVISFISWFNKNRFSLSAILISATILAFWSFRQTEWRLAHRLFSVSNQNDFSWRYRLSAWTGALQIVAEHPWFGVGWNQPEPMYTQYYRLSGVAEGAAIQVNDCLLLGDTLGIPALFCLAMYVWLHLTRSSKRPISNAAEDQNTEPSGNRNSVLRADWIQAASRASAIVLLIGFWFDGGLFKLGTAATFWILLELGYTDPVQQKITKEVKADMIVV